MSASEKDNLEQASKKYKNMTHQMPIFSHLQEKACKSQRSGSPKTRGDASEISPGLRQETGHMVR